MEKKNVWLSFLYSALIIVSLGFTFFCASNSLQSSGFDRSASVNFLPMVAVVFALVYMFFGFKKSAAVYYKIFMTSFFVSEAVIILFAMTYKTTDLLTAIPHLALLVAVGQLIFIKNLGKVASLSAAVVAIAASAMLLVISVFPLLTGASAEMLTVSTNVNYLVLSVIALIAVHEKYLDKTARGAQ